MRRPTIRDVADRANVSIATVSRVFNGKYDTIPISPATIDRVMQAARDLRYSPNAIARSLVSQRTYIIGLVVPDILHNYFPEITRGVEALAYDNGYQVILCDSQEDQHREKEQVRMLVERQCDGIIIAPVSASSMESIDTLVRRETPFVLVDRSLGENFDYVGTDSYAGARIAVQHLLRLGHTRIGHIRGSVSLSSAEETLRGYQDVLTEAEIDLRDELVCGDGYYERNGYDAMRQLLSLKERPTAIFAANDPLALGAFQTLDEARVSVPDEMALVGSANLAFAGYLKVPLTTLDEQAQRIGEEAVRILTGKLKGEINTPQQIRIVPELIVRESCGANRARSSSRGIGQD